MMSSSSLFEQQNNDEDSHFDYSNSSFFPDGIERTSLLRRSQSLPLDITPTSLLARLPPVRERCTSVPVGEAMPSAQEEIEIRRVSSMINRRWNDENIDISSLERRLRDFRFARIERSKKYGTSTPWGIMFLYFHLAGIRIDVEWAEDAHRRREHNMP